MNSTFSIILTCFLVYGAIIVALNVGISEDFILYNFGFSGDNLFARPWTLITSIFLHKDIDHLVSNIFVLMFFGTAVENELGKRKMLLIFFLGAIVGDLFSLFVYPPHVILIGASAGVFALIGVGMLIRPLDVSLYPFLVPIPLGLLGILYAFYNTIGFLFGTGNVSYIAHFGGLFTGLLFGFQYGGLKHGLKILFIMASIMILIPLIFFLLF